MSDTVDLFFKIRKLNRTTQTFSGNLTLLKVIDNSYVLHISLYQYQGNEFRKTPYKIMKPVCDHYNEDEFFAEDFRKASPTFPPVCPLDKVKSLSYLKLKITIFVE